MNPLYGALPGSHVPVRATRGALVAHRPTYSSHRCITSQYRINFIPLSVSLWNALGDPVFDCVLLAGFKSRPNVFHCHRCPDRIAVGRAHRPPRGRYFPAQ